MLRYKDFNYNINENNHYDHNKKIFVKVYSIDDIIKIYDIVDSITKSNQDRRLLRETIGFPNFISVPLYDEDKIINILKLDSVDDDGFKNFIYRCISTGNNNYNHEYINLYKLERLLTNKITIDYNKPRELVYESLYDDIKDNLIIDVIDKNDDFISKIVNVLSFDYKKRKDRQTIPTKINGKMTNDIELDILLSNKDKIKIEYINNEDLKISINNKLLYYDDIIKSDIFNKVYSVYSKYLQNQKFKIKSGHPFK